MAEASQHPCDVTVALLTRNAGPCLRRVLRAVVTQQTASSVELLAVDSGSTDDTQAILREFDARLAPFPPGPFDFGRARDFAFEHSRGGIVVSLSQDAVPAHDRWLDNLTAPLADPAVAASCGRSLPDPERGEPQFPWERNGHFYFTAEIRKFNRRYGRGLSNANSAIRRAVWERLRFGEQPIGEDFLFQARLADAGFRIAFPDDAPVLHHHHYTARSLFRRCRNEGLGLRRIGCAYSEIDLIGDLLRARIWRVWGRDLYHGRLTTAAALAFPLLRPTAVYIGSRFGRSLLV